MKFTAIIPARGGSKGVVDKNIRPIMEAPLISWSIRQALACDQIGRVIVSTDSTHIADVAKAWGAEVPALRPSELAQDHTSTEAVMLHALNHWLLADDDDVIVLLQPTSPLRIPGSIAGAIDQFRREQADSLVSVCESHSFFWKSPSSPQALYDYENRPRRQDIQARDRQYRENGSIYLTKTPLLRKVNNRLGGKITMYCMQECESWEIDTLTDFTVVDTLMREYL